jgi:hypothetical protein
VLAQAAPARTRAHCLSPNVARSATRVQTPTRSAPVLRRAAGLRRPRTAAALTAEPVRLRKRRSRRMRGLHSMLQHSATCCNMLQRSATCVRCTSDGPGCRRMRGLCGAFDMARPRRAAARAPAQRVSGCIGLSKRRQAVGCEGDGSDSPRRAGG